MSRAPLDDLRTTYLLDEEIVIADLPDGASTVTVRTARGATFEGRIDEGVAHIANLPNGTHAVEVRSADGSLLAEEFTSVREQPGDDPVMGFVTSFDAGSRPAVLAWLRRLRCTVVQVYDWMERYSAPLAEPGPYQDPLGRHIERGDLERLILEIKALGAVAQAYAPVCAADQVFADAHTDWQLVRSDGEYQSLGTLLEIMDPGNVGWQRHWINEYGRALDTLGFDGLHLDTYGYPRCAADSAGKPVSMEEGYATFVDAVRQARPTEVISFNQVNGVPRGFTPPARPGFRYIEVWPPNDRWRHLEGLLERSAGANPVQGDTLAIYPPVWEGDRTCALRTAVLSEAVTTTLGASALLWGDDHGVLGHPYYVDHEQLSQEEQVNALGWHRFSLRCRDLFKHVVDTSWFELADENAAVTVTWDGAVSPEPVGGALYARVLTNDDRVIVSLIDLTGSADGSWKNGTEQGRCPGATATVLVDSPERWVVEVAVLGLDDGRFAPFEYDVVTHREGRALFVSLPLVDGWSVLRLRRESAS